MQNNNLHDYSKTHLVIVPNQQYKGGNDIKSIFSKILSKDNIHKASTPYFTDFGQESCMKCLHDTIEPLLSKESVESIILFGAGQGSATVINYAGMFPHEKITGIIIESAIASANSTITHYTKNKIYPQLAQIPLATYLLPELARLRFFRYNPTGIQPINTIRHISKRIPIIMIHSLHDLQSNYHDARFLHAEAQLCGLNNHFISIDSSESINLLQKPQYLNQLHTLLKKYELPHDITHLIDEDKCIEEINISNEQKVPYPNDLFGREKKIFLTDIFIKGCTLFIVGYYLYNLSTIIIP